MRLDWTELAWTGYVFVPSFHFWAAAKFQQEHRFFGVLVSYEFNVATEESRSTALNRFSCSKSVMIWTRIVLIQFYKWFRMLCHQEKGNT
jgi:hypothetical protein